MFTHKDNHPKWTFIAYVREVGSPFALSKVIDEMGKFSPEVKSVKLPGSTVIYPGN